MENDFLKQQYKAISFDIEEPNLGHFERFEKKINASKRVRKSNRLYKYIAVAACFLLLVSIGYQFIFSEQKIELSEVSSEMKKAQDYFTVSIDKKLRNITLYENKNTQKLIEDSKEELKRLEKDYEKLTIDLAKNKYEKRIIYAMIQNFQQRIQILKDLQLKIETITNFKSNDYETTS